MARVNLSLPLPLLAKVTTTSLLFPPKKSSHDLASRSIVYFHVYASCLPFLGPSLPLLPSSQNFISWRDVSVSMPSRSRERSNFSDSPLRGGRRGIETNVSKDKRRVKDPRPRLIWREFPKTSTGLSRLYEINLVRLFELWYRLSRRKSLDEEETDSLCRFEGEGCLTNPRLNWVSWYFSVLSLPPKNKLSFLVPSSYLSNRFFASLSLLFFFFLAKTWNNFSAQVEKVNFSPLR